MKTSTLLWTLFSLFIIQLCTNQAFAHTDHSLGDGTLHELYHAVFWSVFAIVIYKAYRWFKSNKTKHN